MSSLYLNPTIGNFINIVVVKIILLEEQYAGSQLNITTNADTTLSNFCKWQRDLNPADDTHPNHHDVAILITREDICARQNVPCRYGSFLNAHNTLATFTTFYMNRVSSHRIYCHFHVRP